MVHISEIPVIRDPRGKKLMLSQLELKFPDELKPGDSVWCKIVVTSGASWSGERWLTTKGYFGIKFNDKDCAKKYNVMFTPVKTENIECTFTMPEKDTTVTFYGGHEDEEKGKWVEDFSRKEVLKLTAKLPPPQEQKTAVKTPEKKEVLEKEKEKMSLIFSYPHTGKKTLAAGTTTVDIKTNTVTLPGDATEKIYPPTRIESYRSINIYLNKGARIEFSYEGAINCAMYFFTPKVWTRIPNLTFDRFEITTTEETLFGFLASQDPEGVPSIEIAAELDIASITMPSVSTATPTKVAVGIASTPVFAANPDRVFAEFTNDSDKIIYLSLSGTAVMHEGIRLNAEGGAYEISQINLYLGAVSAICAAANKNLTVTEG